MQIGLLGRWSEAMAPPHVAVAVAVGGREGSREEAAATRERNGFASALPGGADVTLAPGAEENGLAIMLADLVRQNLEAKPQKKDDFDALGGSVSIVADDADVALTMRVRAARAGSLTIHDGIVGIPDVTIRGPSEAVLALSNMPLATRLGLPLPSPGDPEAVKTVRGTLMAAMREGKLHVYGMVFHLPLVMKLTRVMSVNG